MTKLNFTNLSLIGGTIVIVLWGSGCGPKDPLEKKSGSVRSEKNAPNRRNAIKPTKPNRKGSGTTNDQMAQRKNVAEPTLEDKQSHNNPDNDVKNHPLATGPSLLSGFQTPKDSIAKTPKRRPNSKSPGRPENLPLLQQADLKYLGAFRVPLGKLGASKFSAGGTAPAYNPKNNSLFLVGHLREQAIAEVAIPEKIVNSKELADLSTASVLQPFVSICPRIPNTSSIDSSTRIGGLLVVDGHLIGTLYEYYDGNASAQQSHFRLSSTNLAQAKVEGLFRVGDEKAGLVAGYMGAIPTEWQKALGATYITGQAGIPIRARTSTGPAAFGFDPKALGLGKVAATPYLYYPHTHRLGWGTNRLFNGTSKVTGVFFAPSTRSVLFFGDHGTGEICYGTPKKCEDPHRGGKGYHSKGGKYEYQVWVYDALEFLAVKNGKKKPWQIKPCAVWKLNFPIDSASKYIGGATFDPSRGRLYVSQLKADCPTRYARNPLIHVFTCTVRLDQ